METTLVTGASGFLGWHVANLLVERGHAVRALVRHGSSVAGIDVEMVTGDLRDAPSLERAMAGCRSVFHVAGDYRMWVRDPSEIYHSNVDGTRNMLEAAKKTGVQRIVYTSTAGCIGIPHEGLGDETTPVSLAEMTGDYKKSKFTAERIALEYARGGLPVVIVNPTSPVGGHDVKPTPSGKTILDYLKGDIPAFIDTGMNIVGARDCALGHLLACERGRVGERYILGSENLTLQQLLVKLAKITGRKPPTTQIPYFVAYTAGMFSTAWAELTGRAPHVPIDAVRLAKKKMWVSHEKARQELGFNPGPSDIALEEAVAWFRTRAR
jgi:dihydroflavonol-4-reductase